MLEKFSLDIQYQNEFLANANILNHAQDNIRIVQNLIFKTNLLRNSLKNIEDVSSLTEYTTINFLQKQLESLQNSKDNLDFQISLLEQQLENIKINGSIKK